MNLFKSKKRKEIENLLANSKQDFGFDSQNVKARLMMAVNSRHFSKEEAKRLTFRGSLWPKYALSLSLAVVLMVSTTGLAFASSRATPGDVLFPVQKFQNQIVLNLPLPESKKEEIRTEIVAKRVKELDAIRNNPNANSAKVQAAVEESQKSMDEAVAHLPEVKSDPKNQSTDDKTKKENNRKKENLKKLVSKLEDLSKQHEEQVTQLKQLRVDDEELLKKIDESVISVKANRSKLREAGEKDRSDD
jgi:hypothetical protein